MDALRFRQYRLVLLATTLTGIAVWVWQISIISGMLEAGRSSVDIGLFSAASAVAAPVAVLLGGLLTDRLGANRLVRGGLVVLACGYLAMAATVLQGGAHELAILLAMAFFVGGIENFYGVGLSVLAAGVVPASAMPSAIGLLLIPVAGGRIVGGLLVGPLVALVGSPAALAMCGVLAVLALMCIAAVGAVHIAEHRGSSVRTDLRVAVRWYGRHGEAVTVVVVGGMTAVLTYGGLVLVPVVAGEVLGKDASAQGLIAVLGGTGVALGVVTFGMLRRRLGLGPLVLGTAAAAGLGIVILGLASAVPTVVLLALAIPFCTNVLGVGQSLILQGLAEPGMRGRVLGLHSLVGAMLLPIGAIAAGWLSNAIGVSPTLVLLGTTCAMGMAMLAVLRPSLARIRSASLSPEGIPIPSLELGATGAEVVRDREIDATDRRRRLFRGRLRHARAARIERETEGRD